MVAVNTPGGGTVLQPGPGVKAGVTTTTGVSGTQLGVIVGGAGVFVGVRVGGTTVLVGVFVGVRVGGTTVLVGVLVGVRVGGTTVLVGVFVGVRVGGTAVGVTHGDWRRQRLAGCPSPLPPSPSAPPLI